MDIAAVVEQLDIERGRIELIKRILTDENFYQRVLCLANDPLGLAHEIIRVSGTAIEDVNFSVRTFVCLKKAGLNTLREVASRSPEELLVPAIPHFGQRCLDEVIEKLGWFGLKLREF